MPQAKLPDSNAAWVRYRNYGLECIEKKNYVGAYGAISEMNALFPDNYRVEVNTQKYRDLQKDRYLMVCPQCQDKNQYEDIKQYSINLPILLSTISGETNEKVWDCLKCKTTNRLETTEIIKTVAQQPSYNKVMPEPPNRKEGITDRVSFHNNFVKWFFICLAEIDNSLGKYREEYKPEGEIEDVTILEGGEDAD